MDQLNLKKDTIITANEYLKDFVPGVKEVIRLFREGNEKEGLSHMEAALEGLQWIYDALTLTQDIHSQGLEVERLTPYLTEMHNALENEDYTLLADLLDFEILPCLYEWDSKLEQIIALSFKNH